MIATTYVEVSSPAGNPYRVPCDPDRLFKPNRAKVVVGGGETEAL
jgi:hypothetical protein